MNGRPTATRATRMPSRGVGDLDAQRREQAADPAVRTIDGGERDAGDRGRQGERQVDHRVDQPAAGKVVAGQNPGDEKAHDGC